MNDRDLAARRIHAEGGVHEGVCWGPTPADYAAADAEAVLSTPHASQSITEREK